MTMALPKVLIIGYGNPGRLDDGLGPLLAEAIAQQGLPGVTVDANYMLTVEDAAEIQNHDVVIFADAAITGPEPFYFKSIAAKTSFTFTSHHVEPDAVLGLAHDMFESTTKGYVLGIRGYDFDEFGHRISDQAQNNLLDAIAFLTDRLKRGDFSSTTGQECKPECSVKGDK